MQSFYQKKEKKKKRNKKPGKYYLTLSGGCISTKMLNHRIVEQPGLEVTLKDHPVQPLNIVNFSILQNKNCT